jgi:hypothetical protein
MSDWGAWTVQPDTPVNGMSGDAAVDSLSEKATAYTWKPFVATAVTLPVAGGDDTKSTGTGLAAIAGGLSDY